jgi:SAM-dependent methyltransferase
MGDTSRHDNWGGGASYESYVGRWSRLVAKEFLAWIDMPAMCRWLDVGCGSGALSQAILEMALPVEVSGIDPSADFVDYARKQVTDARARFEVGDAQTLPYGTATFDAAVSGLVLNFVPDPPAAVAEMRRVVRAGGTVGVYVWDYAGEMQMLRYFWDAAAALDPPASDLDEGRRFPICRPEALERLFAAAGLQDVSVRAIDVPTHFQDFGEYWSPFLGGEGPAPGYIAALSEERRAALRERLRISLPIANDGSIDLITRAWAVRGSV